MQTRNGRIPPAGVSFRLAEHVRRTAPSPACRKRPFTAQADRLRPRQQDGFQPDEELKDEDYFDIGSGSYDVEVKPGPQAGSRREEDLKMMGEFVAKLPPDYMMNFMDLVFELVDAPAGRKLSERANKLLPEGLRDEGEQGQHAGRGARQRLPGLDRQAGLLAATGTVRVCRRVDADRWVVINTVGDAEASVANSVGRFGILDKAQADGDFFWAQVGGYHESVDDAAQAFTLAVSLAEACKPDAGARMTIGTSGSSIVFGLQITRAPTATVIGAAFLNRPHTIGTFIALT